MAELVMYPLVEPKVGGLSLCADKNFFTGNYIEGSYFLKLETLSIDCKYFNHTNVSYEIEDHSRYFFKPVKSLLTCWIVQEVAKRPLCCRT
jgi:hypothetical protein